MPTRKQRRKRQKDLRHEWEEVYVDAEGRELEPEEVDELLPERPARNGARAKGPASSAQRKPKQGARPGRATRGIQPPSWRRVFKRSAIFAPLVYIFIVLTNRGTSPAVTLLFTLELLVVFVPFSYLMDTLTYRMWKKRQAKRAKAS